MSRRIQVDGQGSWWACQSVETLPIAMVLCSLMYVLQRLAVWQEQNLAQGANSCKSRITSHISFITVCPKSLIAMIARAVIGCGLSPFLYQCSEE